jgi:hypothetical protein
MGITFKADLRVFSAPSIVVLGLGLKLRNISGISIEFFVVRRRGFREDNF